MAKERGVPSPRSELRSRLRRIVRVGIALATLFACSLPAELLGLLFGFLLKVPSDDRLLSLFGKEPSKLICSDTFIGRYETPASWNRQALRRGCRRELDGNIMGRLIGY